jgi:cytochrome c oxidase cbb3-type subunit III
MLWKSYNPLLPTNPIRSWILDLSLEIRRFVGSIWKSERRCLQKATAVALLFAFVPFALNSQVGKNGPNKISNSNGEALFGSSCAICHGLDGAGGEHAPNIGRSSTAVSRTDAELFQIIHDGIASKGMPAFSFLSDSKIRAVVGRLRSLQGKSATTAERGDPAEGKQLFFGKGKCADCHVVGGHGRFLATDLTDFAYDHDIDEIRDAILDPQAQLPTPRASVLVTTDTNQRLWGVIRNENNSSLQIQDADGRFYLLMKATLRSVERSAAPSMPANYRQELSAAEVEDIVSYIVRQTAIPKVGRSSTAKRKKGESE